jgi:hypothetical protein
LFVLSERNYTTNKITTVPPNLNSKYKNKAAP